MSDDRDRLAMGLQREVDAWRARAEEAEARIARVEAIDWAAEIIVLKKNGGQYELLARFDDHDSFIEWLRLPLIRRIP